MAAACALRALWAAPPRRAPTRGPAAARAATGAHASPSQRGDRDGATNKNRRRHGPHAPDVNLHWRAKNLERSGDRLGALRLLTSARELYPRNAHIGVSAARLVAEDVDGRGADVALDDAIAIAAACAEHEPNNPVVANLRATLEARRGGKGAAARARELFARSVELDPNHAAAYHAWAVFERSKGRFAKARRLFRECRRADPTRAATSQAWALLEVDDRNFTEARKLFADAVDADGSHAPSWQAWANMERRLGNAGKAERLFRKGEEATRDAARGMMKRSSGTRVRKGKEVEARQDEGRRRRAAIDDDPSDDNLQTDEKTRIKTQGGKSEGRPPRQDKRGQRRPSKLGGHGGSRAKLRARSSLLCSWASFEVARGVGGGAGGGDQNLSLARTLFREAVDTCPENSQAWTQWWKAETIALRGIDGGGLVARMYGQTVRNEAERQLAVADEGLAKCPGNERLRHARALSLKSIGDTDGARVELEALAKDFPTNAHARHSLGLLLQELGEFDAAIAAFESGKDVSLPCLTAAAAAAHHSGDVARARRLFMEGSAVASNGGRGGSIGGVEGTFETLNSSGTFDEFGAFDGSFVDAAAVDGSGAVYASYSADSSHGSNSPDGSSSSSGSTVNSNGRNNGGERLRSATRRDCAAHLRLWALLEKRDGANTVARTLFNRAAEVDPTDGATWLQWGQFERRVSGARSARSRYQLGLQKSSDDSYRQFLYQAWATMEANEGDDAAARDLFARGVAAFPRAATLWLERGLFEGSVGDVDAARAALESGAALTPRYPPVFEALAQLEWAEGNEVRAEEVARAGGVVPPAVRARQEAEAGEVTF